MKKLLYLLGCFAVLAMCLTGCSESSSGSTPANAIQIESFKEGKIIKNKVVSLNDSTDVYVEYLSFTSKSAGNYSLYKNGSAITKYTDGNGNEVSVPSTFTYDSVTGKFTAGSASSYMFSANKEGEQVKVIATEQLSCEEKTPVLVAKWTGKDISFTFDAEEMVTIKNDKTEFKLGYENANGWITASNLTFFYSADNKLYYRVYTTERSEVEAVGRSACSDVIEINSPVLLLANIGM